MYIILSCAVSIDGYLDDSSPNRLLLSNSEDFDRVDDVRASCDAIIVGGNTYRRDQPRLRIRSAERRNLRRAQHRPEHPLRVVISRSIVPTEDWLVYASIDVALADLQARGARRIMVEGGANLLEQFLTRGLADELQLAVAPLLIGTGDGMVHGTATGHGSRHAPRLSGAGTATLVDVQRLDQVVVLRYLLKEYAYLRKAVELSKRCPPSETAFAVGALLVREGEVLATGYSRETGPYAHAEEIALDRVSDPRGATLYSSLEPCSTRKSGRKPCAQRIIDAGVIRVVYAWREPPIFVRGDGVGALTSVGIDVVQLSELAEDARAVNAAIGL